MNIDPILRVLLRNPVFANVLMLVLLVGGGVGVFMMVRESFPDFELELISVTVPYPGADPDEIEEGICRPIEEALEGLRGIKKVSTIASEGSGQAIIECETDVDLQTVKEDIATEIDSITVFPENSETPIIREIRFENSVLNIAIWGDLSERELKELARDIKDELVTISGVSRVQIAGARNYEVAIEISEERLRQYGLSFDQIARAVSAGSLNLPAGSLQTHAEELKIRILGRRYFARQFSDIVVVARPDGTVLRLGDLAVLREGFDDDASSFALFNGKPAINLRVQKTSKEDAIEIAERVHSYLERRQQELPAVVHLTPWLDISRLIHGRIDLLLRNGAIGLSLVFLMLWLFADLRLSFWVTMGIPISLGGGLAIMWLTGQSINMISLFGMIMVLGIIVDDAIVVGEAIYLHRDGGEESFEAVVKGTSEVLWPVVTAVLTTITAFLPLFFVSGIIGKFIGVLPGPVTAALFISLFEALLILPVHLRHLKQPRREFSGIRRANPMIYVRRFVTGALQWFVDRVYGPAIDLLLSWRYATMAAGLVMLLTIVGLIRGGVIATEFFPSADDDFIVVRVELPNGTPIRDTERVTRRLLAAWEATEAHYRGRWGDRPLANSQFAIVGGTIGSDDQPPILGNHLTEIMIELLAAEDRELFYKDILAIWREETGSIPGAVAVRFAGLGGGPPGGNIEVELMGRDKDLLLAASQELMADLATYDGVYEINSDYRPGKREARIKLKDSARPLGLTLQDVARQLRQGYYGDEVMRLQRGRDEVKVMVRYPADERRSLTDFDDIRLRTPQGFEVPIHHVVDVALEEGYATINRETGQRRITVTAEADAKTDHIMAKILTEVAPALADKYHITVRRGGAAQDRVDSSESMMVGTCIALLIVYMIMATIFKSYLQPALILIAIPFGMVGAVLGHMIYGVALSMMSFFGMIALMGIAVNDAIVLLVAVNDRIGDGMPVMVALREAGKRRFRAIILTTLTTFAGLFPMILERSFQAQFLIPMAISIAFGVAFSTLSTLIVIPSLVAIVNDIRRLAFLVVHWRLPTREEVEPAVHDRALASNVDRITPGRQPHEAS